MKKVVVKVAVVAAMLLSVSGLGLAYESHSTQHYDHATVGEYFNKYSMVTQLTISRYDRLNGDTVYRYTYGDGTVVEVRANPRGIATHIRVFTP